MAILEKCAAEPIIEKNCMCRYMTRGIKESCCINFGVMSEIIDKLPRFIPGEGEVPPEPRRGGAALHRAQQERLHRHHLVRPLSLHQQSLLLREPRVRGHQAARGFRDHVHLQGGVRGGDAPGPLPGVPELRRSLPVQGHKARPGNRQGRDRPGEVLRLRRLPPRLRHRCAVPRASRRSGVRGAGNGARVPSAWRRERRGSPSTTPCAATGGA